MPAPGIPNTKELTCTDGSGSAGDVFNVNTSAGQVEIPNNKNIKGYSDAYTTLTWQIANGAFNPSVSATSPALATSGTVTTNVGVARVTPGSAVTAVVLGSGTINGQECWVVNESTTVSNTIAFAASASSFVADGVVDVIPGLSAKKFIWDNSLSAWMSTGQLINGTMVPIVSSAAAALAISGTVTTANVGAARINPGSAVTACVLGSGTITGQHVWVINEAAVGNSVQFAASASSFVADGVNCLIPGLQARLFVWDNAQTAWFEANPLVSGSLNSIQSATAVAIATSGTVTTANTGHSRLNPGSAVNAIVMGTGTYPGQLCMVTNEASVGNYVQMAASATSNVADGINAIIPGVSSRLFVWDSGTSLWYDTSQTNNGTVDLGMSSTAVAIATSGTVTTAGAGFSRLNPGSAVTACVLASGNFPGQICVVSNEAAVGNSIQFAASASSFVADGVGCIIPGLQTRIFCWNTTNWYELSPLVAGAPYGVVSATAPALAISGTITTAGLGVTKVTPGSAVTSCVLAQGVYAGQTITVVNEAAGANTINFAASASSFVADGGTTAIAGLRCATFCWDGVNWFHS